MPSMSVSALPGGSGVDLVVKIPGIEQILQGGAPKIAKNYSLWMFMVDQM
jgi:hypothetical protein